MSAASIASVPDPQHGSQSGSLYLQPLIATNPAARVSLIGASHCSVRYPRLWSASPVTSRRIRAVSSIMRMRTWSSSIPHCFHVEAQLSNIAFCQMLWIVGTLERTDLDEDASTIVGRFGLRNSLQRIFATREKSSSKSTTLLVPRLRYTRFANRDPIQSRIIVAMLQLHSTILSCPVDFSSHSFSASRLTRDSSPDWQVRRREWFVGIWYECIQKIRNRKIYEEIYNLIDKYLKHRLMSLWVCYLVF